MMVVAVIIVLVNARNLQQIAPVLFKMAIFLADVIFGMMNLKSKSMFQYLLRLNKQILIVKHALIEDSI